MLNDYIPENTHIYTVSELNRVARGLMERYFQSIWVEGEISNFSCPSSGHWYFSLKDETAQIRCAMFRSHQLSVKFQPQDGAHVIIRAKGSVYENRGEFQLLVDRIEEIGLGSLQRKFEQLKAKLSKEGLFDDQYKKPIPRFPKCIGVITSPTGAAIQDVLNVLKRRYPIVSVLVYPTMVQGDLAPGMMVEAIERANQDNLCDDLLLVRGGGSLEDLWSFNEEVIARAIFKSSIPIICGVGHEIDFTIADFVADKRAPTPSAAAELATPDYEDLLTLLKNDESRIKTWFKKLLRDYQTQLQFLEKRLLQCHPIQQLQQQSQRLDQLEQTLIKIQRQVLNNSKQQFLFLKQRLLQAAPIAQIQHDLERLLYLSQRLNATHIQRIEHLQQKLNAHSQNLKALDPKAILNRGYSIITNKQGNIVQSIKNVAIGEKITAQLSDGKIHSSVEHIEI